MILPSSLPGCAIDSVTRSADHLVIRAHVRLAAMLDVRPVARPVTRCTAATIAVPPICRASASP